MKVTVEHRPRREVVLSFEAEPTDLEQYRQKAYRHLVQRARIPGFRQGKAPLTVLERHLGKGVIMEEAINHLIPEATQKAIREQAIEAAALPSIQVSSTEPVAWKATVALVPKVDLGNYRDLRLEPEPVVVREELVDKVLEEIRFEHTPWQPVDRAALMGDLLTLDVQVEEDGRRLSDDKSVQFRPQPGLPNPVPGFAEQIVGLRAGETREFTLSAPAAGEAQGERTLKFRVTVTDVKGKNLPALDDEFAKGVGDGFESLQALRDHVIAQLRANAEREAREALREKALAKLVETAKVEYSEAFIEHDLEHLLEEHERRLAQNRIGLEQYLQSVGKTREQLAAELRPQAEQRVVRSLVVTELKEREGITVTPEEVDRAIRETAAAAGDQAAALQRALGAEANRASIERSLLTRKTLDRLVEIVTQKPLDPAAASGA